MGFFQVEREKDCENGGVGVNLGKWTFLKVNACFMNGKAWMRRRTGEDVITVFTERFPERTFVVRPFPSV